MMARGRISIWSVTVALALLGLFVSVGYPVGQRLVQQGRISPASVPYDGRVAQKLSSEPPQFAVWSGDGREMIVSTVPQSYDIWTILWRMVSGQRMRGRPLLSQKSWLASLEDGRWLLERLPDDIVVTAFSPDGTECAGRRASPRRGGAPVRLNLRTGKVTEIGNASNSFPQAYSPDGGKLLITSRGRQTTPEVLDIESGRRYRSPRRASYAFWGPDGRVHAVEMSGPRGGFKLVATWTSDFAFRTVSAQASDVRVGDLLRLGSLRGGRIIACCRPQADVRSPAVLIEIDARSGLASRLGPPLGNDIRTARIGGHSVFLGKGPLPSEVRSIEMRTPGDRAGRVVARFPSGRFLACRWFSVSPSGDWLVFECALKGHSSSSLWVTPVSDVRSARRASSPAGLLAVSGGEDTAAGVE